MRIAQPPTPATPLRHGAAAILNAAALIQARRVLDDPDARPDDVRDAARTLALNGNAHDRQRGARILNGGAA